VSVVITAIGMASSLGPSTCACAAARAGLTRPTAGPYRIEVTEEDARDQVTVLAHTSLAEETIAERSAFLLERAAADLDARCSLEDAPAAWLLNAGEAGESLSHHLPQAWVAGEPSTTRRGHAGAVSLLEKAVGLVSEGEHERCVVGGVDSYIARETLARLDAARMLKTPINGDGFIPGEAAALLLIETREAAARRGAEPLAEIGPVAQEQADYRFEDDVFVPTGAAWARAIGTALERNPASASKIGDLIHDYNGWSRRGRELAMALMRSRRAHSELEAARRSTPVECFGDVGAANGAVALCTAVVAHARGYARAEESLVVAASDDGRRAAVVLRAA
jgi:3-oxoacyl-[acyl-carrier-protein] synthase-1